MNNTQEAHAVTAPAIEKRPHDGDDDYDLYEWGHTDFPDEYVKAPCNMTIHVDDAATHDGAEPCEWCSPDRYERWAS